MHQRFRIQTRCNLNLFSLSTINKKFPSPRITTRSPGFPNETQPFAGPLPKIAAVTPASIAPVLSLKMSEGCLAPSVYLPVAKKKHSMARKIIEDFTILIQRMGPTPSFEGTLLSKTKTCILNSLPKKNDLLLHS